MYVSETEKFPFQMSVNVWNLILTNDDKLYILI